jgi:hypothetical protein
MLRAHVVVGKSTKSVVVPVVYLRHELSPNKANSLGRQKAPLLVPRRFAFFAAGDSRR